MHALPTAGSPEPQLQHGGHGSNIRQSSMDSMFLTRMFQVMKKQNDSIAQFMVNKLERLGPPAQVVGPYQQLPLQQEGLQARPWLGHLLP